MSSRSRNLTNSERRAIYEYLLRKSDNGKLGYGAIATTSKYFKVCSKTVSNIWKRGNDSKENMTTGSNVDSKIKSSSGRKPNDISEIQAKIESVDISKRTTFRSMAQASGISKSSLHRYKQSGVLIRHSSAVRPTLSAHNRLQRVKFAIKFVDHNYLSGEYKFQSMYNYIHIDEKWFRIMQVNQTYYLLPYEEKPHRTTQSTRFIGQVMFLCAVARPRHNYNKKCWFDGKLGIWPFVREEVAVRSSKNRPAGTLELKPTNVTKELYTEYLQNKLFPAIKARFPFQRGEEVYVQQDNAPSHVSPSAMQAIQQAQSNTQNRIQLVCQPPNSPDLNVLDLGFFRSIQSMQQHQQCHSITDLIKSVEEAYNNYSYDKLSDIFISFQTILHSTMNANGGNRYELPHGMKKNVPNNEKHKFNITCDKNIYKKAKESIRKNESL